MGIFSKIGSCIDDVVDGVGKAGTTIIAPYIHPDIHERFEEEKRTGIRQESPGFFETLLAPYIPPTDYE